MKRRWTIILALALGACADDAAPDPDGGAAEPMDARVLADAAVTDAGQDSGPDGGDASVRDGDLTEDDGGSIDPATIPAPRPLGPASAHHVTSPDILFRWALEEPATGARLEVCRDRGCVDVIERLDVTGDSARTLVPPDPGATSRVFHFRLTGMQDGVLGSATSPVWSFVVRGAVGLAATASWGPIVNDDGDRFADVAVGAPAASAVRLYRGRSPAGTTPAPDVRLDGSTGLGHQVLALGDVDGDGFADLGITGDDALFVFRGRAGGLPATASPADADARLALGAEARAAAAGDVDGDGYADLVVADDAGLRVYRGSTSGLMDGDTLPASAPGFGRALTGACDVDGDGYADVVVGGTQSATVFRGSAAGLVPAGELGGSGGAGGYGAAVACIGDVNGDGYPDVAVGAPAAHAVFVYHGGAAGLGGVASVLRKLPGDPGGGVTTFHAEDFGAVIAPAGDVNGDEIGDMVVVAPTPQGMVTSGFIGYAFVYHGSTGGLPSSPPGASTAHRRAIGASVGFEANRVTQGMGFGDLDGDGRDDLAVGTPFRNGGAGAAFVHLGTPDGIPFAAAWTLEDGALTGFGDAIGR